MDDANDACIEATIAAVRQGRDDVAILTLRPAAPYRWRAGQYLSLSTGEYTPRFYSIANAMPLKEAAFPEIHVRSAGKGGLSDHLVTAARPGLPVRLSMAAGDMAVKPAETMPLLLVAGGVGIAPMKALAEQALQQGHRGPIILVWGTNTHKDQYIKDNFDAMDAADDRFRFISVTGAMVSERLGTLIPEITRYRVYLAGSPAMIVEAKALLQKQGVAARHIHHDPVPEGSVPDMVPGTVVGVKP